MTSPCAAPWGQRLRAWLRRLRIRHVVLYEGEAYE